MFELEFLKFKNFINQNYWQQKYSPNARFLPKQNRIIFEQKCQKNVEPICRFFEFKRKKKKILDEIN